MSEMGMTNNQFKAFVKLLLLAIKDAIAENDTAKKQDKINNVIDILQSTLED